VLVGVVPLICLPYVAAAAPKLAMALGHDTEAGWNTSPVGDFGYQPSSPIAVAYQPGFQAWAGTRSKHQSDEPQLACTK
jgi:hypothetical protein